MAGSDHPVGFSMRIPPWRSIRIARSLASLSPATAMSIISSACRKNVFTIRLIDHERRSFRKIWYNCCMRVLFIGGTGIISTACTRLAAQRGMDLTLATRGRRAADLPAGVKTLTLDMDDPTGAAQALAGATFDAVVDWIAFT